MCIFLVIVLSKVLKARNVVVSVSMLMSHAQYYMRCNVMSHLSSSLISLYYLDNRLNLKPPEQWDQ